MDIFDRYYKKYDAWYDENKFAYLSELEALKKVIPKEGRGLEIGVGTGRFARALGIAFGIDPSGNMIESARGVGVTVCQAFGEDLPFKGATFDYVAIIISICFVKSPTKVLRQAWRLLKEKGRLIIGIIDKDSFLGKFYQKKKSVFYKEAHFFSVKELSNLLKRTGYGQLSYHETLFCLPNKMDSIQKPQKGFGKGGFVVIRGEKR